MSEPNVDDPTDRGTVPEHPEESRWYTEHTALLISTLKWSLLGAGAGVCVGFGTRAFLWSLSAASGLAARLLPGVPPYLLLPVALPACAWLIRTFAPAARGHGTEAVIAAVHRRSGRVDFRVVPVKWQATVLTLAFGGSVGKEGPCAQIGAGITRAALAQAAGLPSSVFAAFGFVSVLAAAANTPMPLR